MRRQVLIIGAGLYGLQAVRELAEYYDVSICDHPSITKASIVNQARVHNGYHYPRSKATAELEKKHYQRFLTEFHECILPNFQQLYAIANDPMTKTSFEQYRAFCDEMEIVHDEVRPSFIKKESVQGVILADEHAIDTVRMMEKMEELAARHSVTRIETALESAIFDPMKKKWNVCFYDGRKEQYDLLINCTYGSLNEVEAQCGITELTPIKHEACEVVLFEPAEWLEGFSLTVMDGPFVSMMPFNQQGQYSLTSVCHTPHFSWVGVASRATRQKLHALESTHAHTKMVEQMNEYLTKPFIKKGSQLIRRFVVKAVPINAEDDDNRLFKMHVKPGQRFISILSSKISTIYELDTLLDVCKGELA